MTSTVSSKKSDSVPSGTCHIFQQLALTSKRQSRHEAPCNTLLANTPTDTSVLCTIPVPRPSDRDIARPGSGGLISRQKTILSGGIGRRPSCPSTAWLLPRWCARRILRCKHARPNRDLTVAHQDEARPVERQGPIAELRDQVHLCVVKRRTLVLTIGDMAVGQTRNATGREGRPTVGPASKAFAFAHRFLWGAGENEGLSLRCLDPSARYPDQPKVGNGDLLLLFAASRRV